MNTANTDDLVRYEGDASILANCLRSALNTEPTREAAERRAFKVATCRHLNRQNAADARHLADAYKLLGNG